MLARKSKGFQRPQKAVTSPVRPVPALCYDDSKIKVPAKGPGRAAFLAGLHRNRLEDMVTDYEFQNANLRKEREELRDKLRSMVERYLQMKLPSPGLWVSPAAAQETVGQLSGAQEHRLRELQNEQMALRLRVRSLAVQLGVQRRLGDELRAGITHVAKDSDDETEFRYHTSQLKDEVHRLRGIVEEKKQELSQLRQGLAMWRREACNLHHAVRAARTAIASDILDIQQRRRKRWRTVREDTLVPVRPVAMRQVLSHHNTFQRVTVRRTISSTG